MPHPAFVRAGAQALAALGLPSTLNGEDAGRVHVARSVRVEMDEMIVTRDVATISNTASPRTGMVLVHPDGTWRLDVLLRDNGVNRRYVLV